MKKILLIFTYFHPDMVVSARMFSDLAETLAANGYDVTVYCANRRHCDFSTIGQEHEVWNGVKIHRFSLPPTRKKGNVSRLLDSRRQQKAYLEAFRQDRFDAVILGTHPYFGYFMFRAMRKIQPAVKLFLWSFDLQPDGIIDNIHCIGKCGRLLYPFVRRALCTADRVVDIGSCMRTRLRRYAPDAKYATITPWALVEPARLTPPDPQTRQDLFGDAALGLLYSGNITFERSIAPFVALARRCREAGMKVAFCFAGGGHFFDEQVRMITPEDRNITVRGYVPEDQLEKRLNAADFHLLTFTGNPPGRSVPSKFFASLAVGKPLLISTQPSCCLAGWVNEFQLGMNLNPEDPEPVLDYLRGLLANPAELSGLKQHAYEIYHAEFSRARMTGKWLRLLKEIL